MWTPATRRCSHVIQLHCIIPLVRRLKSGVKAAKLAPAMATGEVEPEASAAPKSAPVNISTIAQEAVDSCADAAAAGAEKAEIQTMINGLVARVAADAAKSVAAEPDKTHTRTNRVSDGVRVDDHRVYRVRGGPLCWTQSADSVTVTVSVPAWVRKEHIVVRFQPGALALRVAFSSASDAEFEATQPLFGGIDPDGSMWMLDGAGSARRLTLELEKSRVRWWPRLFMGDDPVDYTPVDESPSGSAGVTPAAPDSPSSPQT
eukprot:IDg13872t1